jgi:LCP family protein required for cell wall assembly
MSTTTYTHLQKLLPPLFALVIALILAFTYFSADAIYHQPLHPVEAADNEIILPPTFTPLAPLTVAESTITPAGTAGSRTAPSSQTAPTPAAPTETPTALTTNEPAPLEGQSTILVMGVDRRPSDSIVARTDTMMLVSVNAERQTVSLLSIPRDLYVEIPGVGYDRINAAFVHGAHAGGPAGGAALAIETVSHNLGVAVDHYLLVDFTAATRAVDALGGLDIHVPAAIDDPHYPGPDYGLDPLHIPAGWNHFDGDLTLKYARTRYQGNDFSRMERQQQLLWAVRQRILELGVVDLLDRLPQLYEQVQAGVYTDLSLEQIIPLAYTVKDIPADHIQTVVLDYNYVQDHVTAGGAAVLLLRPETATPLIQKLFYAP